MPNYQRFLLKNFQKRARALGWTPKTGEPDDVRLLRPTLLRIVSTYGGDQELAKQARELANNWFENHSSLDPNLATSVLQTAAYYGDKALFERFLAELKKTSDRQERERIIAAMARFRDPAAIRTGMETVLSGDVPFMEGISLLFTGRGSAATRKMPLDFLKAHFDQIMAERSSGGGFDFAGFLPYVGSSYCDEQSKAELKDFLGPKVDKLLGAKRTFAQVLEGIDVCIAKRTAQEPSVEAFLRNY